MKRFIYTILLCILTSLCFSQNKDLKRYYKVISRNDFMAYDSVKVAVSSKYGVVYHVYKKSTMSFELDYYVFEKTTGGNKRFFEMDELTQIKNDSTFMLCDPPLKVVTDTLNWVNGIWFYKHRQNHQSLFSIDSIPPHIPVIDYAAMPMGIYQFKDEKLVKISPLQSWEAFDALDPQGFFFLPNPGFFYRLTGFKEIE